MDCTCGRIHPVKTKDRSRRLPVLVAITTVGEKNVKGPTTPIYISSSKEKARFSLPPGPRRPPVSNDPFRILVFRHVHSSSIMSIPKTGKKSYHPKIARVYPSFALVVHTFWYFVELPIRLQTVPLSVARRSLPAYDPISRPMNLQVEGDRDDDWTIVSFFFSCFVVVLGH